MQGWANIDLESKKDVRGWDLRRRLPIEDGTLGHIYSEHFIEHLPLEFGEKLMIDCYRVLKPGGGVRLSTLDLAFVIDKYRLGETNEWLDVDWSPATPCRMINEVMQLWHHQFVFDRVEFHALLQRAGFKTVFDVPWRQSQHAALNGVECRPYHHELIVEALHD